MNVTVEYQNDLYTLLVDEIGDVIAVEQNLSRILLQRYANRWENFSTGSFGEKKTFWWFSVMRRSSISKRFSIRRPRHVAVGALTRQSR